MRAFIQKFLFGFFVIFFTILSTSSYAQNDVDYYILPEDTIMENLQLDQLVDTTQSIIDKYNPDSFYEQQAASIDDSISQINIFFTSLEDSLQSFRILQEMDEQKAKLLDTLSTLGLPSELSNTIDSLRALPNQVQEFRSKLDLQKYQQADTFITRYIESAKTYLSEQQQKLNEKTTSLLPEEFYSKLESVKGKGELDVNTLSKVDELTSKYELDYKKYISLENLRESLSLDMDFLSDLDGYVSQFDSYTGKLDEYLGELNNYLGKTDVANIDIQNLDNLTGDLNLPEGMQLDGMDALEGVNSEELEKLLNEYGNLDADQLDQRIDQIASNYNEVGELQNQVSGFEGMQAEQLGELEQMQSYAGMKFDEKMALKKGKVLANQELIENAEIVQTAMKEVDAFKKKYAIVTNSNFEEEDVEKPTKHVQLQKRFFYGGDFQLLPGDPFGIDFSGLAGYKLTNRTSLGLAGSVRYEFEESENYLPDFDKEPIYGGRAFLQFRAIESFFLQGEVEAANVYNESQRKIWEINYLAGIGRSMALSEKIKINVTFLYHINNKDSYAHDRPFVIRVGLSSK